MKRKYMFQLAFMSLTLIGVGEAEAVWPFGRRRQTVQYTPRVQVVVVQKKQELLPIYPQAPKPPTLTARLYLPQPKEMGGATFVPTEVKGYDRQEGKTTVSGRLIENGQQVGERTVEQGYDHRQDFEYTVPVPQPSHPSYPQAPKRPF